MPETRTRYVSAPFVEGCYVLTIRGIYQYDHGLKLKISGQPTKQIPQMHFAYDGQRNTIPTIPVWDGDYLIADIPDTILMQPKEVWCYIYIEDETSGYTIREIHLPQIPRGKPTDTSFTPEQINNYNALVSNMNTLMQDMDVLQNIAVEVEMVNPSEDPTAKVTQDESQTLWSFSIPNSNVAYATFEVDHTDGCLYMTTPEGLEDIDFQLSDDGEILLII